MKRPSRWIIAVLGVLVAAATVTAAATTASGKSSAQTIVIGAAVDLTSSMKPFDSPALAGAQIEAAKLAKSGGPKFVIKVCNHQLKKQKSCAAQLVQQGAKIALDTCDVEYGAAATQEFINKGLLTIAPCTTTDQMGPQRFGGTKGKLAYTVGGTAQDEGSAEAEYAYSRGWRTAIVVKDNKLVYFRNVSDAFAKRWQELGGKIVDREAFTSGDKTIGNVISKVAPMKADVISFVTAFGELPQFVGGIRSAGNKTPIINSWGGDGTYWNPKNPKVTDYYVNNYASSFGDDPNKAVNALLGSLLKAKKVPYTASFVLGAATIDLLAAALKKTGGSTNGAKLAAAFQSFKNQPTISGPVTYSAELHSVTGRPWRIMKVQNNKETYLRMWKTKKVVTLP
jgi:branched-chain amino acid transport system substrate-binding protein